MRVASTASSCSEKTVRSVANAAGKGHEFGVRFVFTEAGGGMSRSSNQAVPRCDAVALCLLPLRVLPCPCLQSCFGPCLLPRPVLRPTRRHGVDWRAAASTRLVTPCNHCLPPGPCGLLAGVQAFLLKQLLFPADPQLQPPLDPVTCPAHLRDQALCRALAEILWRVSVAF